jgi:hypothetical protein
MSPRYFTKHMLGQPNFPHTHPATMDKLEGTNTYSNKSTLRKISSFFKSPAKISNKTEWLPYQGRPYSEE